MAPLRGLTNTSTLPWTVGGGIERHICPSPNRSDLFNGPHIFHINVSSYKLTSKLYRTSTSLQCVFPNTSPLCWQCRQSPGSIMHLFWSWTKLVSFWSMVGDICHTFTTVDLGDDMKVNLFYLAPISLRKEKKLLLVSLLNAARKWIPASWKQISPPTIDQWFTSIHDTQCMESLTSSLPA